MALSLEQLRTPVTKETALAGLLDTLEGLGFNVTAWQSGSVQRTMLEAFAITISTFTETVKNITDLGFNDTAEAAGLTELSRSHYDNTRIVSIATIGDYTFTGGASGPPHTIVPGQIIVADAAGRRYQNTTGGTVPVSGTLEVLVKAQIAGGDGNVANDTITVLKTPLAGVTGSNSPIAPATSWITTQGLDAEADAVLRVRNSTKWAVLNIALPAEGYIQIALAADTDVTRVTVDDSNPRGAGTVDVYLARATDTAQPADVATVQAEFDTKRPVTADTLAIAAATVSQAFTFEAWIESSKNTPAKQAEIAAALDDHVNGLPIGGTLLPGDATGSLLFSELVQAISQVDGVVNVVFSVPTADVSIAINTVMTVGVVTPTYTSV